MKSFAWVGLPARGETERDGVEEETEDGWAMWTVSQANHRLTAWPTFTDDKEYRPERQRSSTDPDFEISSILDRSY